MRTGLMLAVVLPFASAAATNITVSASGTGAQKPEAFGQPSADTKRIQDAIDTVWKAGGGRVVVLPGVHHVGGIRLRSNVELHLASNAVLSASRNCADFEVLAQDVLEPIDPSLIREARGFSINAPRDRTKTAIWATNCVTRWNNAIIRIVAATNVVISGEAGSAIDGNNSFDPDGEEHYRGVHGIGCFHSGNVAVRGVELRHTGNWATRFAYSEDLVFENLTILGGHDGVHVRGCNRIRVRGCRLFTGDDCIAGYDNEDLAVSDCELSTACNMLRLGGRDILIENCRGRGPSPYPFRGSLTYEQKRLGVWEREKLPNARYTASTFFLYFCDWSQPVRTEPGNIVVRNCRVENVHRFLRYNYGGETWQHQRPVPSILFENCRATGLLLPLAANAKGEGERFVMPFTLRLRDSSFAFARPVDAFVECLRVEELDFANVSVDGVPDMPAAACWGKPPKLSFENVRGLRREVLRRTGKYKCPTRLGEAEALSAWRNKE